MAASILQVECRELVAATVRFRVGWRCPGCRLTPEPGSAILANLSFALEALEAHVEGGAGEIVLLCPEVGARLAELCRSVALAGRQVHDANIVATMLAMARPAC